MLSSCQYNLDRQAQKAADKQKRDTIVSYNIQLAMGYMAQGDMPRAKRKLLIAQDRAPDSAEVKGAMAYFLEKTGDIAGARDYYRKALEGKSIQGASLNNYGAFLCRLGHYAEADSYFLKAIADKRYINSADAYENAGLCANAIPDKSKARAYFIRALEQDSRRKQSLYELVSIELENKNPESALAYLQQYQALLLTDKTLLTVALQAAHQAGEVEREQAYTHMMMGLSGEKNEYHTDNG